MKTGVIVGRFQSSIIHDGYADLMSYVYAENEQLVIVVGDSEARFTNKHPLPFETRELMLSILYPNAFIKRLQDNPSDDEWDRQLDKLLEGYPNVTLYGSRDSFIKTYHGVNKTKEYNATIDISSTIIRGEVARKPFHLHNRSFREGIIYAAENRYPVTFPTVDIAMISPRKDEIILGKKANNSKLCFPGGFVDRKDESLEEAAMREFREEVKHISIHRIKYISSHQVDDWRYRGCSDGIMTTFFVGIGTGLPKAGDDLQHVGWYPINDFDINDLQPCHHILFESLINYLE